MILDEASNVEKASIEMQLYGQDGDTEVEDEIPEDENAILGKNRHSLQILLPHNFQPSWLYLLYILFLYFSSRLIWSGR